MAYSTTTLHMLISCPGDVTREDQEVIHRAVNRWNFNYGRHFQVTVLPIRWGEHASGGFGEHPQDIINRELVDDADLALAIFWTRLGTESDRAASGTAEEMERMAQAGKTVTVLHCRRPTNDADLEQQIALREYLKRIKPNALVMDYVTEADLISRVDNVLSRQAEKFIEKISDSRNSLDDIGVWPSVDFTERVETDSKGRVRTRRSHYIVLTNKGNTPAKNVAFKLEPDDGMVLVGEDDVIAVMAPESETRYRLVLTMGSPRQFNCSVKWTDVNGEERENVATLRPV
ncbi:MULTISPECIES: hypothetical protein [unclassified Streptomyces]|uniref:hypothetical protein n=1 Tax=unclassified Streptomyces TaxID=2593676 RepID=UPI0036E2E11A